MDRIPVKTPNNIQELISCLAEATLESKLVAGGTDYFIAKHKAKKAADMLIDLSGIQEMRNIRKEEQFLTIGAGATFTEIYNNSDVRKYAGCLAEAASTVGSTQIRNRATLGGNIANASPAGDSLPALLALKAEAEIVDGKGVCCIKPIEKLLVGAAKTTLKWDEAILNVKIPIMPQRSISTFAKIGSRSTVTISKISMAVVFAYNEENDIIDARIALGAVGMHAYRPTDVERALSGRKLTLELGDYLGEQLSKELEASLKGRSSMPYKKEAIKGLAHDALSKLI